MATDILRLPRFLAGSPPALRLLGDAVMLRPPERTDYETWAELRAESKRFLTPWEPSWSGDALSRAAFRRRLARYATDWRSDQGYSLFIFRREDGKLMGGIGLTNLRRGVSETASLGYWMGERYAGRGFMKDALRQTLSFAFERLHLHRIEAACLPHNAASRHLLLRCGFREEGFARKYLCIDGKWQDHVLFGLLREEWTGR
jgi:[ribosomal protein S5]-alanine N-acetyltransferase